MPPHFSKRYAHAGWPILNLLFAALILLSSSGAHGQTAPFWPQAPSSISPPLFDCQTIRTYPHDTNAFTQGLIFSDGFFFEGTGLKGHSTLRKVDPRTGRIEKQIPLHARFFGEGITRFENRLIQLTWKSRKAFAYDIDSFEPVETYTWPREGWGITTNGRHLIASDGSHRLFFHDPNTFQQEKTVEVKDARGPVQRLNELEWVEGFILANIWQTDKIAVIQPQTGRIAAWITLNGLALGPWRGVPNGIAYDPEKRRLFVTGKKWPKIFEVVLIRAQ